MKIGFFIENFTNIEFHKEPGAIVQSLNNIGHSAKVFCNSAESEANTHFAPQIISKKQSNDASFWRQQDIDYIIIYSWLSLRYTKIIKAASSVGIKIFLKLDSDGNLIYPEQPSYMKTRGLNDSLKEKLIYIIRLFQWFVVPKFISKIKIQQIELSEAILIESPQAKEILAQSLLYWKRKDLIEKIKVIEPPLKWIDANSNKENTILCIGRWDYKQKNTKKLITVMNKLTTNWHVKIIGTEANKVVSKIKNPNLKISFINNIEHTDLLKIISTVKIIFMPSIWEGFPLAACEGVTAGCSIVGGPLPGLIYLTSKNNGIITNNLQTTSLCNALQEDINRWENNYYQPEKIANDWRAVLSPEVIAKKIINLMKES
jgi:hypothetical protein